MEYSEDDFLMLSGIQHFVFCRRQWALIHIEQQWAENLRTVEGQLFHQTAHDAEKTEKRGDLLIVRGLKVKSAALGISGNCDVVEFHKSPDGICLFSHEGLWEPYPIEYKRGSPKMDSSDEMQLCTQATCLEEMLLCEVPEGSLFYGENRRRTIVEFTPELRERIRAALAEMHDLMKKGYTPKVKPHKGCSACSLKERCLPQLGRKKSVNSYIDEMLSSNKTSGAEEPV